MTDDRPFERLSVHLREPIVLDGVAGRTCKVTSNAGVAEREVTDDAELLALYREHVCIDLDAVPAPLHPRSA